MRLTRSDLRVLLVPATQKFPVQSSPRVSPQFARAVIVEELFPLWSTPARPTAHTAATHVLLLRWNGRRGAGGASGDGGDESASIILLVRRPSVSQVQGTCRCKVSKR